MLRLIATDNHNSERRNLQIARAHIESAIAHINDAAQGRIGTGSLGSTDDLRLLVTALADVRTGLAILDAEDARPNSLGLSGSCTELPIDGDPHEDLEPSNRLR